LKDIDVEPLAPSEFLGIANSYKQLLKQLLEESSDVVDTGSQVKMGVITMYDKESDRMQPEQYVVKPKTIPFILTSVDTGIQISLSPSFMSGYSNHFIKRMAGGSVTILQEYDVLQNDTYIDTDATYIGTTYTYRVYVENLNNQFSYEEHSLVKAVTDLPPTPSGITISSGTTAERTVLGATLSVDNKGTQFFDTDDERNYWWNGTAWV
jgi:hypothetical protein